MNTRFKLFLITYLNQRRIVRDSGFALPLAVMVGACIIVVGLAVVIQAQGNKSNVTSQVTSAKAMAIAEAGATQYVNFLNNNRGLIPYPSCVTQNADGSCADATTVSSWANATVTTSPKPLPEIVATPSTTSSTSCTSTSSTPASYQTVPASTITNWANSTSTGNNSGWKDLPNNAGQYRLVGYTPTRSNSSDPKTVNSATLTVEGRVNQTGTGATATDSGNTGKARIQIIIPAAYVPNAGSTSSSGFPGLWARDFKFGGSGKAYSNVLDSSDCLTGTQAMPTAKVGNIPSNPIVASNSNNGSQAQYALSNVAGTITAVNQAFPALPTASWPSISNGTSQNISGIGYVNGLSCPYNTGDTFPRNGDEDTTGKTYGSANPPASDATYAYSVCKDGDSMSIVVKNNDITLGQSGQETFKFYTAGTVKLDANGNFVPKAGGTTKSQFYIAPAGWFEIGANGNIGLANDPTALQFYVYATDGGTINNGLTTGTNSMVQSILLGGNGSFYGFVFGPNANAKTGGTGDIAGSLWAKSYESGGNGGVVQGLFANSTRLDVNLPSSSNYGISASPTSWKRVQTN